MSLAIVVDMNLSPEWIPMFGGAGWPTVHWSQIGDPRATDAAIMAWARAQKHVVFTHDLDFGTTLALTHATGPSVIQVRTQNLLPDRIGMLVVAAIRRYAVELESGAIVVIDLPRSRVRILPL
jgi:predicted nuclease of predicted toxin-antitoxin system